VGAAAGAGVGVDAAASAGTRTGPDEVAIERDDTGVRADMATGAGVAVGMAGANDTRRAAGAGGV